MQSEKVTKYRPDEEKRRYDDACGSAHALELIGERWALLVLRELMFGARRFSELRADLPGISANVLTQRLGELEKRGLVRRVQLPPPASVQVYEATEWGLEAAPVIRALGRWAVRSPRHDPELFVSRVSIMMSMQTMFDRNRAMGVEGRFGFRFPGGTYVVEVARGTIAVERGPADSCDVVFAASPEALAGVLYGDAPLETVEIKGDRALAKRFVDIFELPPKVELPAS